MLFTRKRLLFLVSLVCFVAIGTALISQHVFNILPCAWCVLQRLIYLVIAIICLLGVCGSTRFAKWMSVLSTILAITGAIVAGYQHAVASHLFSCHKTFAEQFITATNLEHISPALFGIYSSCRPIKTTIFGISYVWLSLGLFIVLALMTFIASKRKI